MVQYEVMIGHKAEKLEKVTFVVDGINQAPSEFAYSVAADTWMENNMEGVSAGCVLSCGQRWRRCIGRWEVWKWWRPIE